MSLRSDLAGLPKEMQMAAAAALALALSLVLPWYQKSYFQGGKVVQANVSALGVFTFVEAAVLLVAVAVLFLVWARSQRRGFHLPGGDGVAITLAGCWALLLLVWRLFDKPDIQGAVAGATIGIQWGIFGALLAAGALIAAGARVRAAHRPEPPNPAAEDLDWENAPSRGRESRPDRRPREASEVADVLRERPAWEGDPREPGLDASRAQTTRLPEDPSRERTTRLDDAPTTRLPDDRSEERTTRLPDDRSEERTTRLPDDRSEERTTRLPDDHSEERTTRLPDDRSEERTTRLPNDPADERTARLFDDPSRARTTRLPDDPSAPARRQPRPDHTPPLWEDDSPGSPR